jgi:hypothetical protein
MSHDSLESFLCKPPGAAKDLIAFVTRSPVFSSDESAEFNTRVE